MRTYRVTSSAVIEAPAETVYAIIADYRDGHPHILPRQYFTALAVERGGRGAGTVIRFRMRVLGRTREFRAGITEPEPGRVLVETNGVESGGAVTTFTVDPAGARRARVTITTELRRRAGLAGALERYLTERLLRRIYRLELKLLAARAGGRRLAPGVGVPVSIKSPAA